MAVAALLGTRCLKIGLQERALIDPDQLSAERKVPSCSGHYSLIHCGFRTPMPLTL